MSAAPAKDKKQIVVVSIFGVLLLVFVVYAYNSFFGGAPNPAATPAPVSEPAVTRSSDSRAETEGASAPVSNARTTGQATAPGIAAKMMASTSSSLDPTLDESAMLRTESLVYTGTGRNIFSAISAPPPMVIPKNVPSARPDAAAAAAAAVPTGPPPPPPINLKYFGTAVRLNGKRQAFLLQGEDVYLASEGDIVARKYRIVSIGATSIQVEDLVNNDTQTLPLVGGGSLDVAGPRMHSSVENVPPSPVNNTPPSRPAGDSSNNSPGTMPNRPPRGGFRNSFQNSSQN
jgi:hypothetical protein